MKKIFPSVLLILGICIIYFAFAKQNAVTAFDKTKTPKLKTVTTTDDKEHPSDHHHPINEASHTATAKLAHHTPATTSNTAVTKMSSLLKNYAFTNTKMNKVIDDLDKQNMNPQLLKDSNPHTGTMYVLRTDTPLPGTRYFHAQYFTEGTKEPYLQHMSFDIKPEKNAFRDSISAIKKVFGTLSTPSIIRKDFILWPWKKGYNIWIQKLTKEDLHDDPYNAYEQSDIGTIKIAVEMDIH